MATCRDEHAQPGCGFPPIEPTEEENALLGACAGTVTG